jgi:uncharacterized protein YcfJ
LNPISAACDSLCSLPHGIPCEDSQRWSPDCLEGRDRYPFSLGFGSNEIPQEKFMNAILRNALVLAGVAFANQAVAEVTFYEREDFKGRSFNTEQQIENFKNVGFNDRASSVVVDRDWWQVCEDAQFGGRCVFLRPGRYGSLGDMGLNNSVSSVRLMRHIPRENANPRGNAFGTANHNPYLSLPAEDQYRRDAARSYGDSYPNAYRYAPVAPHDYRRRYDERTYEANVTSVRAVVGPPEQRCWVEREQVVQDKPRSNAPGAIVGALIGGILGHQFGGGSGQDLATAGGAVGGALVGANINRDRGEQAVSTQDVQHCEKNQRHAKPEYWDVSYTFRGRDHRMQMTAYPGPTVTVNERGEPRE